MPTQIGISITKRVAFRDATQEFSNTYHYGSVGLEPQPSLAEDLIDEIVANEKTFHSTLVSFVYARCWSSGGTQAENSMIFEKALTGTGARTTDTSMDKERAVLIQWPAGNDSKGRPVYLRKWYHPCGQFDATHTIAAGEMSNTTKFTDVKRAAFVVSADKNTRLPFGINTFGLVAESGRERSGGLLSADPPTCHPYLEHHQMGDQWRG